MSADHRETPLGYKKIHLDGISATVLMPETWFFKRQIRGDTKVYYLTEQTDLPYETGLMIHAYSKVKKLSGRKPSVAAKQFIESQPKTEPITDIEEVRDGNFRIFRRQFSHNGGILSGHLKEPSIISFATIGNDTTDMLYFLGFETPTVKWEVNQKIAKNMIEGFTCDSTNLKRLT